MSRSCTRARKRRARLKELRAAFQATRQDPEALEDLLRRQAESSHCLWDIARPDIGDTPLDEAEQAMIAQVVAPRLAGLSTVRRLHERSGMDAETAHKYQSQRSHA
jgi:hypothetical protein